MTTKKTKTSSATPQWDMKTSKEPSDESQKNYYYDYYTYNNHYCKEEIKKDPIFSVSQRGRRIIQQIAEISLGIILGLTIASILYTAYSVRNIEKMLDKKAAPVHTVSSTTNTQTK
jgi:hypothetical protein